MDTKIGELVRAQTWDDYVGQTKLKGHFDIKIQAARRDERLLDSILLLAPPGSGKTNLVELIAERLGDELLYLPMPMALDDFMYAIEMFMGGIVFLDELHNAPRAFQEKLQFAILDGYIPGRYGERIDTRKCTFIGATTKALQDKLLPALVQRFRFRPAWEPYTDEEMAEIVAGMARRAGTEIPAEVCRGLARAAGGTPRIVQDLVAAARDLKAVEREVTTEAVLDLAGFDADGLTADHMEYLQVLHGVGGTAGLALLTSMLRMSNQTLQDLERVLVMRGCVKRTAAGRKLMPPGVAKIHQADVGPTDPIARRRSA